MKTLKIISILVITTIFPLTASAAPTFYSPLDRWHVTSNFGPRRDPFTGRPGQHGGIDLLANVGTPIRPVAAGRVHATYNDPNAGQVIVITHGDEYESHYYHLSRSNVRWGQVVDRNTIIGLTGNSGRSRGPHLHLSIKHRGFHLDPARQVRPLPSPSWGELPPNRIGHKSGFGLVHPPYPGDVQTYRDGNCYWIWQNNRWSGYMIQSGNKFYRYDRFDPTTPTATYTITRWFRRNDNLMQWEGYLIDRNNKKDPWHCVWR